MSLIVTAKSYQELNDKLNSDLKSIQNWLKANRLVLNFQKTNYVIMGAPREQSLQNLKPEIDGIALNRRYNTKVLGFHIDNNVKFDVHLNKTVKELNSKFILFTKLKKFLPKNTLNFLYNSLVKPKLEFGCVLWGYTYETHLKGVIKIQKRFARLITGSDSRAHSLPLFKELKWFSLLDAIKYHSMICIYKSLNGLSSDHSKSLFMANTNRSSARLGRHHQFINAPKATKNFLRNTLFYKGVDFWNSLPPDIRSEGDFNLFKSKLKIFINN